MILHQKLLIMEFQGRIMFVFTELLQRATSTLNHVSKWDCCLYGELQLSKANEKKAPETIEGQPQTEKVDVFSFGILLWEIYTQEIPWDGISDTKILQRVQQSQRPDLRNKNIPDAIKQLIIKCWSQEPTLRPSFKDIEHYLNQYCLQQEKQ